MTYVKVKNGNLYCYDENSGFTLVFKNNKWRLSQEVYASIISKDDAEEITVAEANEITNGASVKEILDSLSKVLDTSI